MINNKKKELYKKNIINNILKNKHKQDIKGQKNLGIKGGGLCSKYNPMDESCGKIIIKIDPTDKINWLLNKMMFPINFLSKLIMTCIKHCIEAWNKNLVILSTVFENYIINIIFSVNGYIKVTNIMMEEIRLIVSLLVIVLTGANPFSIMAIYTVPLINELSSFIMDGITTDIFYSLVDGDTRPIKDFINAGINLLAGRTVKNKCNIGDYSSKKEMTSNCYQWNVPACRLNIGTMYKMALVFWITIYIAAWFSFLKIFYVDDTANTNIIKFIRKIFFNN